MAYRCPKCERYGMEWDARAKVLTCYYDTCRHVIRMGPQKSIPSPEKIAAAIVQTIALAGLSRPIVLQIHHINPMTIPKFIPERHMK